MSADDWLTPFPPLPFLFSHSHTHTHTDSRLAFLLAGINFEDDRIAFESWKDLKPTTPFGQLPIMKLDDDDTMLTQSAAMLRYVGLVDPTKTLYPVADPMAVFAIEEAMGVVADLQKSWGPSLTMPRSPSDYAHPEGYFQTTEGKTALQTLRREWVEKHFQKYAGYLEALLAKHDDQWLASGKGASPTLADCVAVPVLRNYTRGHIDHVPTDLLDAHPALKAYVQRFCALPAIKGRYTNGLY